MMTGLKAMVVEALARAFDDCAHTGPGHRTAAARKAAERLFSSAQWLAAMAAERDAAYQRGYVDGWKHAWAYPRDAALSKAEGGT